MQKILLSALLLICTTLGMNFQLNAQANATCQNASMIGPVNPTYALPINQPSAPVGNDYSCLGTQPNPLWFYFQLNGSGSLSLELSNSANVDVDFILYGPFASAAAALAGCGNLGNGSTGGSIIDCSFSVAATEYADIANGSAGEYYMLLVTNFSNQGTTGNTQIAQNGGTATMTNPYVGTPVTTGTCANLLDGAIATTVTNGTAPYSYIWSNGATTSDISGLAPGTYGFTVTDAVGATFANSSIYVPALPPTNINSSLTICSGDSALIFGTWRYVAATYSDTIATASGCDSVYNVTLNVNQPYSIQYYELCTGDSIFAGGAWQFSSGFYADTITVNGCDSVLWSSVDFYNCLPVWPGDADDNFAVDGNDWLQLGLLNGYWGSLRANASLNWIAQPSFEWGQFVNAVDAAHADCDGNGYVSDADTLAIIQNYSLTHLRSGADFTVNSSADVQLIPQQSIYNVGDWVTIDVVMGQSTATLVDVYGYFFKIDMGNIFRPGTVAFTPTNSFLGQGSAIWTLSKELSAVNQLDIAQVRNNQIGMNGFGKVGEISFILSHTAGNSSPVLGLITDKVINSTGSVIPVTTSSATFAVNPTAVQSSQMFDLGLKVVPNPVVNQSYLEFNLQESSSEIQVRIINSLGQVLQNQTMTQLTAGLNRLPIQNDLVAGVYFIEISSASKTSRISFIKL